MGGALKAVVATTAAFLLAIPAEALALPGLPDDLDDPLPKADVERFE